MPDFFIIELVDSEMVDNHPNQLEHAIYTSCEYNVKDDMIQIFLYTIRGSKVILLWFKRRKS